MSYLPGNSLPIGCRGSACWRGGGAVAAVRREVLLARGVVGKASTGALEHLDTLRSCLCVPGQNDWSLEAAGNKVNSTHSRQAPGQPQNKMKTRTAPAARHPPARRQRPPPTEESMFRLMRDGDPEDPMFAMDPFAIHRQHMNRMLSGSFGFGPLLGITDGTTAGARQAGRRMQAGAVSPFGMLGMAGGFIDMFGMMNDMIGNMEHMTSGANCQTFTSSTVISYSNLGDGPKVYQETSEMRSAPGGIRETRRTVRDSDSGLEQMSIGHHIRERAHIMQRSRNHRTGDQEERQDYINMDESDAAAFDDEWRRETSRFRPQRGLDYRRHEDIVGGAAWSPPNLPTRSCTY
ncbi:myeloid leukemia factor 2 [Patagioenas fasciata monilis]|uniref:Myeloid leukemia factor 2 n=1 Tax=Patagioenas fasciata monilis TaxID=372326 RepID=A0A1V4JAM6_PATFA|nr:myeloid leukemia factor 2 [Patagioenas fasciata monilis]